MAKSVKRAKKVKSSSAKKLKRVSKPKDFEAAANARTARAALAPPPYTYDGIADQVISCLTSITGVQEIYSTDAMDGPKFQYNSDALRALAEELKQCFAHAGKPIPNPINLSKIGKAKVVEDVCDVVAAAFGL